MLSISIDIDWAHDAVIADTLELMEMYHLKATWFVTHDSPLLDEIRRLGHELGLHPNFNPLLEGRPGSADTVLDKLLDLVPEAKTVRSHSLTRSSRLAKLFHDRGLTHESNFFLPPAVGENIQVWRDFAGLIQVPIRWEDDVRLIDPTIGEPADHLPCINPFVVNFHPIHLFLNTAAASDYEDARDDARRPHQLRDRRRPSGSNGSRDRLVRLIEQAQSMREQVSFIGALVPQGED